MTLPMVQEKMHPSTLEFRKCETANCILGKSQGDASLVLNGEVSYVSEISGSCEIKDDSKPRGTHVGLTGVKKGQGATTMLGLNTSRALTSMLRH